MKAINVFQLNRGVERITDADYYPLPENNKMTSILSVKPKKSLHLLDSAIEALEQARPLFENILGKYNAFHENVGQAHKFTRARDFVETNPLDEWTDITDEPWVLAAILEKQGLIATISMKDDDGKKRFYARPGV